MAEETITQETTAEDTGAQSAAQENTTEKTFTQSDLNRVGSQEKKQGETAILSALGLKSKDELAAIKEIIDAHKTQKTDELTAADVQKSFDEYKIQVEAEKEQMRRETWVDKNHIPVREAAYYLSEIDKLIKSDSLDFIAAATQVLKDNPVAETQDDKAPMWGGTGKEKTSIAEAEKQKIMDAAKAAMRIK